MQTNTFLKQLLFSTVRIVCSANDSTKQSIGTGFLVSKKIDETKQQIFLVTNKHVIAESDSNGKVIGKFFNGIFAFIKNESGNPKLGDSISIQVKNITDMFMMHPDENVDLAICNISNLFNDLKQTQNQDVFIRPIPVDLIPKEEEIFDAVEDVTFIGYPNGIFDQKNHLPIIRRGTTATPYEVDFNGGKKFIIDAQVFPGSSGSPVFVKEQNFKNGSLSLGPEKYFFVGVISKVFQRDEIGNLKETTVPTKYEDSVFFIKQAIGLGICEKSNQILHLIDLLNIKK